ncbi:MAG: plastocyanin/azurin family copper-binding protein [Siculibacillus sp.]|nr:plastocyanin/azurin family copper-binding protein [Siculibacillus sp.]
MAGLTLLAAIPAAAQDVRLSAEERATICAEAAQRLKGWLADHPAAPGTVVVATWREVFCPEAITVKAGEKVLFVNVEKRTSHSVWFKTAGRAESPRFFPDESFEQPVDLGEGDHDYVCGPHPWMRGRIRVEGAAK